MGYIQTNGQARVKDLVDHLGLGNVAIHRQLKALVAAGKINRIGSPPKVFYTLNTNRQIENTGETNKNRIKAM